MYQFAGFVLLWTGANAVVDCGDQSALMQEQLKCFEKFNIRMNVIDGQDILTALQNNLGRVCRYDQAACREALTCARGIGRSCLDQVSVNSDILPSAGRVADGVAYMCRQDSSAKNQNCTKTAQSALVQCMRARAETYVTSTVSYSKEYVMCEIFQMSYDCMRDTLEGFCGEKMARTLLAYLKDCVRPSGCAFNSATSVHQCNISPLVLPAVVTTFVATALGLFVTF